MVKDLAEAVEHHAGDHGFVVIGGTVEMQNRVRDALPKTLEDRIAVDPSLYVEMRDAELRRAVGNTASELTKRFQMSTVEFLFDQARAGGRATTGYRETERALEEMRVDTLLLSRTRTREQAEDSDRLIGMAFEGGAHVEEVGGAAGDLLDLESEGIASRLRYRYMEPQTGHPDEIETPEAAGERARREATRRSNRERQAAGD